MLSSLDNFGENLSSNVTAVGGKHLALISADFLPFISDLASGTGIQLKSVPRVDLEKVAADVVSQRLRRANSKTTLTKLRTDSKRRYIVAPLLHQTSAAPSVKSSLRSLQTTLGSKILRSQHEDGPKVLKLSPLEAAVLKERFTQLLIEEDIQYRLPRTPLLGDIDPISVPKALAKTLTVQVEGNGTPLGGARVVLLTNSTKRTGY